MRLFTTICLTLLTALSALGQAIDYRALRTNQFSTNIPSRGYVGIIGYGVTNIPGTNVQFNSGTGITFTTNGASITITATGTNQANVTNVIVRAGTNVVVETNAPTDWTINASTDTNIVNILGTNVLFQNQYWVTNAGIASSISNRYAGDRGAVWINGGIVVGSGVSFLNNSVEINGGRLVDAAWTPNTILRSDSGLGAISVGNGTGMLTNDGSGVFGWYPVSGGAASVVVAGTNVTVVTNGIAYTVSSTAVGGGGGAIGPGTVNQVAKFVATTNVGDSIYQEVATNMWVARSKWDGTAYTNHITNTMVGQWTSPTNWTALDLVSAGPANEFNELHAVHGSSYTTGDWPLKIMETWSFEDLTPVSGHTAGQLFPVQDDVNIFGDSSHRVKNGYFGTGGVDIDIAATKPALRFHNGFNTTWYGVDGTGSSLAFYRDTGITAAFDRPNNNLCFDVAGNYIGFGNGISNCTAFLSTGESVSNGLVQIGTNSAVASPLPVGIMAGKGSGSDKGAADLVVAGGVGTGQGRAGNIYFATAGTNASTSSTLNSLTNRMEIDAGTGNVIIYSNLTVNGSFSAGSLTDPNALTNNDTRNITFTGSFTDTRNGVSTVIDSNTITSGMLTLSGSGTNYFGANLNVNGTVNATGYTNSGLTASRLMLTDANKAQASAAASGAVPVDADGSAATFAQVSALAPGFVVTNGATGNVLLAGSNTHTATLDLETSAELRTTNNAGTSGQVLTSAGSSKSPYWAAAAGGASTPQWLFVNNQITPGSTPTTFRYINIANGGTSDGSGGASGVIYFPYAVTLTNLNFGLSAGNGWLSTTNLSVYLYTNANPVNGVSGPMLGTTLLGANTTGGGATNVGTSTLFVNAGTFVGMAYTNSVASPGAKQFWASFQFIQQ